MAGVLEFTLGLEANQFLNGMGLASGQVLSLSAVASGLGKVMQGVWAAIDRGGALQDLADRTRQSVGTLYQLQEALNVSGAGADSAAPMISKLQKSLSGVTETGEQTSDLLGAIGIKMSDLKGQNAASQIATIAGALKQLDIASASGIAGKIFGREGAANILQISGDLEGFKDAIRSTAQEAAVFERTAAVFDLIGDTISLIKSKVSGMFAGIGEGLAPLIVQAEKFIKSFDFVAIGEGIGNFIAKVTNAVKTAKLEELLQDSFAAAVEFGVNFLVNTLGNPSFWEGIFSAMTGAFTIQWSAIMKMMLSIGSALEAVLDTAFQNVFEALGKSPAGKLLGLQGYQAQSFNQNFTERRNEGQVGQEFLDSIMKSGFDLAGSGMSEIKGALADAIKNSGGPAQDALVALWKSLPGIDHTAPKSKTDPGEKIESISKPDVSALEKIGFVFGNAGNNEDHARRTADNTSKIASLLEKLPEKIARALPNTIAVNN